LWDKWLFNQQIAKVIPSLILWGPPGTGKTTLAHSTGIKTPFFILSAINSGVKDIREVIEKRETKWRSFHHQEFYL
jgi:replication-associated recombination protein RarA